MKKADQILTNLMNYCRTGGYDIIIPNFYVGNWEMDLFRMLPSEYVVEYEIKISRSDFFNDFKKDGHAGTKHDSIKYGKRLCNRFFFVVPEKLVSKEEVPSYAGLIYHSGDRWFDIIKPAPLLHKNKRLGFTDIYKTLAQSLSFREANLRSKVRQLRYDNKKLSDQLKFYDFAKSKGGI